MDISKHSLIKPGHGTSTKQPGGTKEKKNLQSPSTGQGSELPQTTRKYGAAVFQNESGHFRQTAFLS
jgi:hypothetical protein